MLNARVAEHQLDEAYVDAKVPRMRAPRANVPARRVLQEESHRTEQEVIRMFLADEELSLSEFTLLAVRTIAAPSEPACAARQARSRQRARVCSTNRTEHAHPA